MEEKRQPSLDRDIPDEHIIELFWQRDESAIALTDKKYRTYLFTIAFNILRDEFDCDECLNDTYLSTWNSIPPTRPGRFSLYLSKITRNLSVDKYRKKTAKGRVPAEIVISLDEIHDSLLAEDTIESEEDSREIIRALNAYLSKLSSDDAFIFICRYYYFDRIEKIADMLSVSEKTVYRRLSSMRKGLKEHLIKEGLF